MNRFEFEVSRTVVTAGPAAGDITLVAQHHNEPIGIAAGGIGAGRSARLARLRVKEQYRRRRVATTLLRMLEREFLDRDCCQAEATIVCRTLPEGIGKLMVAEGWPGFQLQGVLGATDYDALSAASWMSYKKLPCDACLFSWAALRPAERHFLCLAREQASWFPRDLDPLCDEEQIDECTSFGLRWAGEVAGWCIFHRLSGTTNRCASLYLREELQNRGYAFSLAAQAVRAHAKAKRGEFFSISLSSEPR